MDPLPVHCSIVYVGLYLVCQYSHSSQSPVRLLVSPSDPYMLYCIHEAGLVGCVLTQSWVYGNICMLELDVKFPSITILPDRLCYPVCRLTTVHVASVCVCVMCV